MDYNHFGAEIHLFSFKRSCGAVQLCIRWMFVQVGLKPQEGRLIMLKICLLYVRVEERTEHREGYSCLGDQILVSYYPTYCYIS